MCILQDRVIDKLIIIIIKTQPIAIRLFVVITYDIFHISEKAFQMECGMRNAEC